MNTHNIGFNKQEKILCGWSPFLSRAMHQSFAGSICETGDIICLQDIYMYNHYENTPIQIY